MNKVHTNLSCPGCKPFNHSINFIRLVTCLTNLGKKIQAKLNIIYLINAFNARKRILHPVHLYQDIFENGYFFFAILTFCPHVSGRRFGRQKKGFRKRLPVRVEFLKTPSCRFLLDGRKRSFSNTTLSCIQHILCKRRYRTLFPSF